MSLQDDAFAKVFVGVLAGLIAFTVLIIILANTVGQLEQQSVLGASGGPETVEDRIRPIGKVRLVGDPDAEPAPVVAAAPKSGKEVVDAACAACHSTGAAGAPKTGVKEDWDARLAQGFDTLVTHAIQGIRGMPARGGNPSLSDGEMQRAVAYMVEQVGGTPSVSSDAPAAAPESAAAPEPAAAPAPAAQAAEPAPMAPVAAVTQEAPAGSLDLAGADLARGENVHKQACAACHGMGVIGAPKTGDKAAWEARLGQGLEVLTRHAIEGLRGMPPKGGRLDLTDDAVADAVAFMVRESR